MLDRDNSGTVSADELYASLVTAFPDLTKEDVQEGVKEFDKDGSGDLNLSELEGKSASSQLNRSPDCSAQEVEIFFRQLDVDGNNKISAEDLLCRLNLDDITIADIEEFIANFDVNDDGCLDQDELRDILLSLGF
ncbi:unnamed protein product [Schistocephalus solidus]|uniref:Calmodulin n=1 Tax=Schistocephalus solidus TaxID=70667 RepID=A0A183T7A2_SCHSO|nr:unnamed protein product [Schistocephalus solidus]